MKKYMFGLGADAAASAKLLKDMGYDAVALSQGNASAFAAARDAGLETYLCYGAHSLGDFPQKTHGARDCFGNEAKWFGSGCPNSVELRDARLHAALEFAAGVEGLKGVLVDGARFASFASEEGVNAFFGCFCDKCMLKMGGSEIREGVRALYHYLRGADGDMNELRRAVSAWLDFKEACVREYMDIFAASTRDLGLLSGAFVFAPSLSRFVGQTPEACAPLDIVAPMLYRDYPHEIGTACLGHEWAAFKELLSRAKNPPDEIAERIFGVKLPEADFTPEYVGRETAIARKSLRANQILAPIVQTEDDLLDTTFDCAMRAGADGCGEFMFSQKRL